jgi:single-strand DNA-binding protein
VIFNENLCRIAEQYLKKGSKVFIEGQLQTRKREEQGMVRYATEVVLQSFRGGLTLLDRADGSGGGDLASDGGEVGSSGPTRKVETADTGGRGSRADMDDEIPF